MTKPIYEPSVQRDVSEIGFSNNQLFRRPAVAAAGASNMPVAWVYRNHNFTISSGPPEFSVTEDADDFGSTDETVMIANDSGGGLDGFITFLEPGFYVAHGFLCFTSAAFTSPVSTLVWEADPLGFPPGPDVEFEDIVNSTTTKFAVSSSHLVVDVGTGYDDRIRLQFQHSSGANRTMTYAALMAIRVAPWDPDDGS